MQGITSRVGGGWRTAPRTGATPLARLLDAPAVQSNLPLVLLDKDKQAALREGRPIPMSRLAVQADRLDGDRSLDSGVTDRLLQRVADQDLAEIQNGRAEVLRFGQSAPVPEETTPEALAAQEAASPSPERSAASGSGPSVAEARPPAGQPGRVDYATLFTQWRRGMWVGRAG